MKRVIVAAPAIAIDAPLAQIGGTQIVNAIAPRLAVLATEFSNEAGSLFGSGDEDVEIDAVCDGGALFLIRFREGAMVCLTDRSVLPGLIFYDVHAVLTDLDRAAGAEARRVGAAER